jgi:hypothetical protein
MCCTKCLFMHSFYLFSSFLSIKNSLLFVSCLLVFLYIFRFRTFISKATTFLTALSSHCFLRWTLWQTHHHRSKSDSWDKPNKFSFLFHPSFAFKFTCYTRLHCHTNITSTTQHLHSKSALVQQQMQQTFVPGAATYILLDRVIIPDLQSDWMLPFYASLTSAVTCIPYYYFQFMRFMGINMEMCLQGRASNGLIWLRINRRDGLFWIP